MKNFPEHYRELTAWMEKPGQAQPDVMKGFAALHEASIRKGALDSKNQGADCPGYCHHCTL